VSDSLPTPADHAATLSRRIATHTARLTVIGQGYVGLPLAVAFANAGFTVTTGYGRVMRRLAYSFLDAGFEVTAVGAGYHGEKHELPYCIDPHTASE